MSYSVELFLCKYSLKRSFEAEWTETGGLSNPLGLCPDGLLSLLLLLLLLLRSKIPQLNEAVIYYSHFCK